MLNNSSEIGSKRKEKLQEKSMILIEKTSIQKYFCKTNSQILTKPFSLNHY